jgi:hypothetical protein
MIGYVQDGTPDHWHKQVNTWITELAHEKHIPAWEQKEHLTAITADGKISEYSSVVLRKGDQLNLAHLWIDVSSR